MTKPPFELLSNKIIKNLFLNVNRQIESFTLIIPRMEREENLTRPPHPYPLPRRGEERMKMKRFKHTPSPLPSPARWRGLKKLRWKGTEGV
jgi:hypothetical protein